MVCSSFLFKKKDDEFKLNNTQVRKMYVLEWKDKILNKPWLLTQTNTVPKSVKMHPDILNTYRSSWCFYLSENPSRIWEKTGRRRVYMSYYGLLSDFDTVLCLSKAWNSYYWQQASDRMKTIPAIRLSFLYAILSNTNIYKTCKHEINITKKYNNFLLNIASNNFSDIWNDFRENSEYFIDELSILFDGNKIPKTHKDFIFNEINNSKDSLFCKLLSNQNGLFSDKEFDKIDLNDLNFKEKREKSWLQAIKSQPYLWFVFPEDIKEKVLFNKLETNISEISNRIKRIPNSFLNLDVDIQYNEVILNSYLDSFIIYIKNKSYSNELLTEIPYPLLAHIEIIKSITFCMKQSESIYNVWFKKTSDKYKNLPSIQLAILNTINELPYQKYFEYIFNDVKSRRYLKCEIYNTKISQLLNEISLKVTKNKLVH
jgi:hypothetical protein